MSDTRHDNVRRYYDAYDEWRRLEAPEGRLEHARTLAALDEHLTSDQRVLDLGGGPGRYSAALAERGCRVVLADVSLNLLDAARARFHEMEIAGKIESIDQVNALDLGRYATGSFDAVLAMGPLYHLVSARERAQAAGEMMRVLRRGGMTFASYIPRVGGVIGLIERAARSPSQVPSNVLTEAAETGVFRNPTDSGFQEGYYAVPGEIERTLETAGAEIVDVLSLKSIQHRLADDIATLDSECRAEIGRVAEAWCRRPEIIATSGHALVVARKSDA